MTKEYNEEHKLYTAASESLKSAVHEYIAAKIAYAEAKGITNDEDAAAFDELPESKAKFEEIYRLQGIVKESMAKLIELGNKTVGVHQIPNFSITPGSTD